MTRAVRRIAVPMLEPSPTVLLLVDFIDPLDFEGADAPSASTDAGPAG